MSRGRFGVHGGQYMSETLMNELLNLEEQYNHFKEDPEFVEELNTLLKEYAGRPSLLYYAKRMTEDLGGAKIYLKREDLNHTGAHKINNVLGQCLLAKKMGKTRVIAETGAGQHGVATATAAALLGMECEVFMGEEDTRRQALNVFRMELLGAKVHTVTTGSKVLKDAVNDAFREWISRVDDTHYVIGSTMGPHPFPTIVRDFQAVISEEIKDKIVIIGSFNEDVHDTYAGLMPGSIICLNAYYALVHGEHVLLGRYGGVLVFYIFMLLLYFFISMAYLNGFSLSAKIQNPWLKLLLSLISINVLFWIIAVLAYILPLDLVYNVWIPIGIFSLLDFVANIVNTK